MLIFGLGSQQQAVLSFDFFLQSWTWSLLLQGAVTSRDFHGMPGQKSAYGDCSLLPSCQDGHLFWEAFFVFAQSLPTVSVGRTSSLFFLSCLLAYLCFQRH